MLITDDIYFSLIIGIIDYRHRDFCFAAELCRRDCVSGQAIHTLSEHPSHFLSGSHRRDQRRGAGL